MDLKRLDQIVKKLLTLKNAKIQFSQTSNVDCALSKNQLNLFEIHRLQFLRREILRFDGGFEALLRAFCKKVTLVN